MHAHDGVHRIPRAKRLANLVTLAGSRTLAGPADVLALLALARAAELAVLVERLRVFREALLEVLFARSPTHENIVDSSVSDVNQYCGDF
jgi:hypothetical protein